MLNMRSLLLGSMAAMFVDMAHLVPEPIIALEPRGPGRRSNRIRTGAKYPHSSTRQRARYARQIAAGQIKFLD